MVLVSEICGEERKRLHGSMLPVVDEGERESVSSVLSRWLLGKRHT